MMYDVNDVSKIDFKKDVKITCRSFSLRDHSSIMMGSWFYLKNGQTKRHIFGLINFI